MPEMPSILDKIVAAKREELADAQRAAPLAAVQRMAMEQPRPLSLSAALSGDGIRLIAEVKKASPSRGLLSPDFDPVRLAGTYIANGAAAVSCLTDPRFQGELAHLSAIKQSGASGSAPGAAKGLPLRSLPGVRGPRRRSRRHPAHCRYPGAAAAEGTAGNGAVSRNAVPGRSPRTKANWKRRVEADAEIIGINNRDLHTFTTDLAVSQRIAPLVPGDRVVVSESGIFTPDDLRLLSAFRVNAVLVGEAIVTALDVAAKVRELSGQGRPHPNPLPEGEGMEVA